MRRPLTGSDVRRALDLRSTWFRIGVLSLATPDAPVTFGGRVSLNGVARNLPAVGLEQREVGQTWRPAGRVARGPNGSVTFAARPKAPTDYRLASGAARSKLAHVAVAPLVRFRGMKNASTLHGVTRPVFPGAKVAVQRLEGSRWTTVVRAPVDARGRFDAQLALSPGRLPGATRPRPRLRPRRQPHAPRGTGMRRLALAAFLLALVAPAPAGAARYAVGLQKGRLTQRSSRSGSRLAPAAGSRRSRPSP